MLRKRSRPVQEQSKGHLMSHAASDGVEKKSSSSSFLHVPGLLVRFTGKGPSDCGAVWSPTSPLDKAFSSPDSGSPTPAGTNGRLKCWDSSNRVGLSLLDSRNEDEENMPWGKASGHFGNRNIVFGLQLKNNVSTHKNSLPHDYGILSQPHFGSPKPHSGSPGMNIESKEAKLHSEEFEFLRSCSVDTGRSSLLATHLNSEALNSEAQSASNFEKVLGSLPISFGSSHGLLSTLSVSEIEQSEDYTCIISHGPNPKMTHIFGDCILENHFRGSSSFKNSDNKEEEDSLSCCGNKALCSCYCCAQERLMEQKMEIFSAGSTSSSFHEESLLDEMALASQSEH
ncbi:FCS-Like Zinc finger 8-like [Curcuma longa]|uniref:FCS-Like Zinc finger 8-like n=1 Tax=Curcuma longa TaxID=136217 RepID=UPI003D9E4370